MNRYKSAARPLALLYAGLVAYASLFPFTGWRSQGLPFWSYLDAPWPQYWTRFDVLSNFIGYMPLGFLAVLALLRTGRGGWSVVLASLAAAVLSFAMESLQMYLPQRVASNVDLGLNAAGGVAGALLGHAMERMGAIDRWRRFRARWFVRNSRGALVLLALWPLGLLFPAPVAFGMGQMFERVEQALADWLQDTPFLALLPMREMDLQPLLPGVEAVSVALGALMPVLLGYSIVRHPGRRVAFAVSALTVGVLASALSAGLSFGPVHAWAWFSQTVGWGLQIAIVLAGLALVVPAGLCVPLLMLVIVAQVSLLNAAPESPYFALTLQSWEQGRFIHFNGVAQWVGWVWPYACLVYLVTRIGRPDGGQPTAETLPRPASSVPGRPGEGPRA